LQLLKLILDPDIQHRCRATALKHFSLADGIDSYKRIYRSLDGQSHNG